MWKVLIATIAAAINPEDLAVCLSWESLGFPSIEGLKVIEDKLYESMQEEKRDGKKCGTGKCGTGIDASTHFESYRGQTVFLSDCLSVLDEREHGTPTTEATTEATEPGTSVEPTEVGLLTISAGLDLLIAFVASGVLNLFLIYIAIKWALKRFGKVVT